MKTFIKMLLLLFIVTGPVQAEQPSFNVPHATINNTIWKVVEYDFDYYYGYHNMDFYLRYEDDDWWKWDRGFPFPLGLSGFWDKPRQGMSFGFDYGAAQDMYHFQYIEFQHDNCTAVTHCYRFLKDAYFGKDAPDISYVLTLFKISDDWDGVSPPPQQWDGVHNPLEFDADFCGKNH